MMPAFDAEVLRTLSPSDADALRSAIKNDGFLIVKNTQIATSVITEVIETYRAFFTQDIALKSQVDMSKTGSNRGWGASQSEQVDPNANPDYKEVFDSGFELAPNDPLAHLPVYAPNLWPSLPKNFEAIIKSYYAQAMDVAMLVLRAVSVATGNDPEFFKDKFSKPMALLRGNYYPSRPDWAGAQDFGIAEHTDYGCVTLLATDGVAGLEAKTVEGQWVPVTAHPGEFVINFGEMLQMWTKGQVRATPHRVIGTPSERISIPLFFNPNYDTNVAPLGSGETHLAGHHLDKRFRETYIHLQSAS